MADLPLTLKPLAAVDLEAIERLNARTFGPGRFARSAYRLREGVAPDLTLSFAAWVGTLLVGANIMTPIRCGDVPALLLGPLTVDPPFRSGRVGEALVRRSLEAATEAGHALVLLVGDLPYYARFGFATVPLGQLDFGGPVDPARLLYRELIEGAFATAAGTVRRAIPVG
ncbi:putative N-acetyltransferase YhbS [Beijerinckiaceae bacterium RH AL1]|nr:N-acetyltransferase [Beijerinckiaceae bacterium]VVB46782.1 putative N-acetyltransferase YhbS [Beijerinckiaceae bacterium RH CH11]VVB46865.1 putative N-acetyltransferase YhbS [Beijerinckiaceae bacterium RH AL8]VVC55556.1 putative N-acetyltransferase YhbS [Beijerinckiaceae bacterium RH AL1]